MIEISEEEYIHWQKIGNTMRLAYTHLEEACDLMQTPGKPFCPLERWNPAWALLNHVQDQLDQITNHFTPRYIPNDKGEWCWTAPRVGGGGQ